MNVKFPQIEVQLSGEDGNAFFIISRVARALKKAGRPDSEVDQFRGEAMAGNYDNVIQTAMRWVSVS